MILNLDGRKRRGASFPRRAGDLYSLHTSTEAVLTYLRKVAVAGSFQPTLQPRLVGGYRLLVACGLSLVWLGMWAAYVVGGRPTPVEPEIFKVVAALDLLWLVPPLAAGGALLWKRRPWGFVIASAASVQGAIYLLVLSVNSAIAIHRSLAAARTSHMGAVDSAHVGGCAPAPQRSGRA